MALLIHIDSPILPVEEFARRTAQTPKAVRTQVAKGQLPTVDLGLDPTKKGRIFINMVKLAQMAEQAEFKHPSMNED